MRIRTKLAVAALAMAVAATAHHSAAPFYDSTKTVEAQGVVTKFLIKNPHSFLYFDANDTGQAKGQKVEWQIELGASSGMARLGWTQETLKPGTQVKVVGQPSRAEGSHGMCCAKITRPDGSPVVSGNGTAE